MKIALIPIDNRPVCYTLVKDIAKLDSAIELFMPERKLLGGLTSTADIDGILRWLDKIEPVDAIILSLDTIAYGGLVSSRRCKDSLEEIKSRLDKFKEKLKTKCNGKVYAFSSIMRISNNNVNEEEKKYWDTYGEQIFEYSYNFHMSGLDETEVPPEIIHDYLATRNRNFSINKMYMDWIKEGIINTLVFSKDDCAQYGFNVLESQILERMIKENDFQNATALVKTGADEIPLSLFSRAICDFNIQERNLEAPKIAPRFLAPQYKDLISKYEDISIEKSVSSQIELANAVVCEDENTDLTLIINNFEEHQGEIVMKIKTKPFEGHLGLPDSPYIVADVRFANGADIKFVSELFKQLKKPQKLENFYGFSAWNTSANTLGSLICAAIVKFYAIDYNKDAFEKLQITRFLDDWAYQANVRQAMKKLYKRPDVRKLKKLLQPFEKKLSQIFEIKNQIKYNFPWKRYFEVEVIIKK